MRKHNAKLLRKKKEELFKLRLQLKELEETRHRDDMIKYFTIGRIKILEKETS